MVTPYKDSDTSKKVQVAAMFDSIAARYDFLNHFLSFGIDKGWRRKAIRLLKPYQPKQMLDIATGTGDFAIEALKLSPDKVTGVDISTGMLAEGRKKMERLGLNGTIELLEGDSENLPFKEETFEAITVAFGVRNFENLSKGLEEMHRVLKPGGVTCVLEFSQPRSFPMKQLYHFYSFRILPFWGRFFSKDKTAYSYLPESVQAFPDGSDFLAIMRNAGFKNTREYRLTFGIATIYLGDK
ncbi:bifunctional demethylmenaquinone methyltransferase/2-methoxy-6-polyprenyl-1,4-benzoquinol methylase UbiE [Prolixibacter denitrificans]|uniref:Demethylmenaquinone methyltransferase n=1 Tax=Prolixibacter denitrificans TaxID=1541063 RepID=A0A2P8CJF1_9BACT|nr:bifunctional demethylmenaquinone methyltransferase/2-methoxy-6-polyprenyl-1,4-benzoquinol methylase UbiE [Prolixibacter denitrificans]PSK85096.1 demethylmenaquinone methyltransferase/2-methoxy-6-polyprenyl-1,4-benzoquinol methylase [Prolixibacter denitrificans]GET23638.1 demethylmenaquinone methyltransferase [Prolixibacter denitrificans]